ncbi:tRNA-dihydrouridine synthase family protein [Marinospirillum sp.]|uniref:tRNA dihydrouridine synthase n=1 Tax=Marinospirillum sp. TaxID=2183934 RepID=UPI002870A8B9|nr:tRNA-dihydrouridine synthase family protein [Marinospirillum sp.]MDR9467048.1 tRNA-dihydrouridine synthase family protein [Marinospirillum sp.]
MPSNKPRVALAPMEGVLEETARHLITQQGGWDFCVTEFVRVSHERLPPKVFHRICPELKQACLTPSGVPVHLQLLGSDPESMAVNAQVAVQAGAQVVDLNFGCPAKIVNRHGGGARLLTEPDRVQAITAAVVEAVQPLGIPVTAKMRLGYEDASLALDNALALQAAGISQLVVHARTKTQGYKPPAHWERIAELAEALTIPVFANGEIWTLEDYRRCVAVSGVQDVMLGRTALADPWLAVQIKADAQGLESRTSRLPDLIGLMLQWMAMGGQLYTERVRVMRIKQWLLMLVPRWGEEARRSFEACKRLQTESEVIQLLQEALDAASRPRLHAL